MPPPPGGGRRRLCGHRLNLQAVSVAFRPARRLVPQSRRGPLKIGITAEMKTEQDDRLERRDFLSQPTQRYLDGLQPPEIVGQVENPTLGAIPRLGWRAFDRLCYCIVLKRLSIHDRINRMRIVAGGFRLGNLHHFWDTERVARPCVPLEAADERR